MRDADHDVSSFTIRLNIDGNVNDNFGVYVTVFGTEPQPFITEVYAQTDTKYNPGTGANGSGYVAVELYNPHTFPITLTNWKILRLERSASRIYTQTPPGNKFVPHVVHHFDGTTFPVPTIPAGGYLILENFNQANPSSGTARYRPASSGLPQTANINTANRVSVYCPDLDDLFGHEMLLVRPRRADGTLTAGSDGREFDEARTAQTPPVRPGNVDLVPVDQFDFMGFGLVNNKGDLLHYARPNGPDHAWECVYPGRYNGSLTSNRWGAQMAAQWNSNAATDNDPWKTSPVSPAIPMSLGVPDANATYSPTFAVPAITSDWAGDSPLAATGNRHPYGAFARDGDLLKVLFIGSWMSAVKHDNGAPDNLGSILEFNSLPMEAAFADDLDPATDAYEQIGRFIPLASLGYSGTDHYAWTKRLFDYFTVDTPHDDYFPAYPVQKWTANTAYARNQIVVHNNTLYRALTYHLASSFAVGTDWTTAGLPPSPIPVKNALNTANGTDEQVLPTQGRININTAHWRVLAALPMDPDPADCSLLARAIFNHRITSSEPFESILDLNRVPVTPGSGSPFPFEDSWWRLSGAGTPRDADDADGDYSPVGASIVDASTGDFEERTLAVTRISNLITTRSDSFTVYVVVQGWRGAGTSGAELVSQRRAAFVIDRSKLSQTNRTPTIMRIPTN
jgi:DNA uptake protein ComE-like DNA-binding protein